MKVLGVDTRFDASRVMPMIAVAVTCALAITFAAPACAETRTDDCTISGDGLLTNGDHGRGTVAGPDTSSGTWAHDGDGSTVVFESIDFLLCRINGSVIGDIGGPVTFDGATGFTGRVQIQDRSVQPSGARDTLTAIKVSPPMTRIDGVLEYPEVRQVVVPASLPVTSGNAGHGRAWLTFAVDGSTIRCEYRGTASPGRSGGEDAGRGDAYDLDGCSDRALGADDRVDASVVTLHVHTSANGRGAPTPNRVEVSVDVTSYRPNPDLYTVGVFDEANGERVYMREAFVAEGDFSVIQH